MNVTELKDQLTARNISFKGNTRKSDLQKLLKDAVKNSIFFTIND